MSRWPEPPHFGDHVVLASPGDESYDGIIINLDGPKLTVFLANGLTVERDAEDFRPSMLPGGASVANFAEIVSRDAATRLARKGK